MIVSLVVLLGLTGIVAATSIQDLPSCALGCYAQAVGNTSCGLTDSYCQCTTGYQKILGVAIPCLCHSSDCTTEDLIDAQRDTNKICSSALASSSQDFAAATFGLNVCQATATGTTVGIITVASASASATNSPNDVSTSGNSSSRSSAARSGVRDSEILVWEVMAVTIMSALTVAL